MPATTANLKLPYPLPTDPIADGANQIKALAEVLDTQVKPLKIEIIQRRVDFGVASGYHAGEIEIEKPDGFTTVVGAYCSYFNAVTTTPTDILAWQAVREVKIENNKIVLGFMTWAQGGNADVSILVLGY